MPTRATKAAPFNEIAASRSTLQRKCACGTYSHGGAECAHCAKKPRVVQRKFTIGASNDALEAEADRIADQVMLPSVQRGPGSTALRIQQWRPQSGTEQNAVAAGIEPVPDGEGEPLPVGLGRDMEHRFGRDFSAVRMHVGATAQRSASAVNAAAYTIGNDIVFGAGRFAPETLPGRKLIAHELTHVVQQSGGSTASGRQAANAATKQSAAAPIQRAPAQPTLKSEGVDLNDPVSDKTAAAIDAVLARSRTLRAYVGDKLKGGFKIAEQGKFVKESIDNNFDNAYQNAYGAQANKSTMGFYDPKKSEIHLRPSAQFGTALHESIHRLAAPTLYTMYLPEAGKVSSDLLEILKEGVTAHFTDCVLKEEQLPNYNDAYASRKAKARALLAALGSDGFDLLARFNFGGHIEGIGKKFGIAKQQFDKSFMDAMRATLKQMKQAADP